MQKLNQTIMKAGLLAGSMDITAACVNRYIKAGSSPELVLRFIASGIFGKEAFTGSWLMPAVGLLFHFIIAFSCAWTYFMFYPRVKALHANLFISSFLIAAVAWIVTHLIIMPLSNTPPSTITTFSVFMDVTILFFCIGLPIAWIAKSHFRRSN